ncbi:MAG: glutamate synthase large subunit [Candidatus Omnitrophica bacterium]|nr:glutamate synthase large subunit [Candidatus Omnitrophota bacterium]
MKTFQGLPEKQGLYDPAFEKDSCGVGFVCNIDGKKTHEIIKGSLKVLNRLSHRGAVGSDPKTGDGAGILIQIPHAFLANVCQREGISLPQAGWYGTGLIFLPQDKRERIYCENVLRKSAEKEGGIFLGWRDVPVDNSDIGKSARSTEPVIKHIFVGRDKSVKTALDFERQLYTIRKSAENIIRNSKLKQKTFFYITNISSRTLSYKGLLMPHQLGDFFVDLKNKDIKSALSLVHSRYSTNTFPTWDLAQPFRFLAHNGEINTLRGNINWMTARESLLRNDFFGRNIEKIKPVIVPGGSDSAAIDNIFELLALTGRSLPHAIAMLIPAAWGKKSLIDRKLKDFYKYHACFMEPWDGPAAIAFTDGINIGAVLDRNGLRPARYLVTKDGLVVMSSEVGVLDIRPENISFSGRLEPGKVFFIDTEKKRILEDENIKEDLANNLPYGRWIKKYTVQLDSLRGAKNTRKKRDIQGYMKAFGYTREDIKFIMQPMAETGAEPVGSMGNDTPHAILSKKPQVMYNYFKQLFAQVTNPAIDPIREELVMSLRTFVGFQRNILEDTPLHCRKLDVRDPILTDGDLEKIQKINAKGFKTKTLHILFDAGDKRGFRSMLDEICRKSENAIKKGYTFLILSDRGVDKKKAALPALLAVGAVHHYLVKKSLRTRIGIILESAEPREVHHLALLFGYGADLVNPYLAYEIMAYLHDKKELKIGVKKAVENYRHALYKGMLKILSKMGISTLRSYKGAQVFEALGLGEEVIKKCFAGTVSRIEGAGFDVIKEETLARHREAFAETARDMLDTGGIYQWKKDGEFHLWNPESIALLQYATRTGDYGKYLEFADRINNQSGNPTTLRSLFRFKKRKPIPVEEVEPVKSIAKRFATGAMSFGSISGPAHETLAIAMNKLGARSNTGEGGEDPARFAPLPNGDSKRSAIKQVASGRFGVTINYLVNADELQIKIAQGAKPGEGGQLPGHKVSEIIAKTRYTTPGVTLISPPPHHDIYSIEDLAQLIFDLKNANPRARISVKLVSEIGVGTIAAGVAKGHADMILISGGDGGTGASPLSSIRHAGLPWELGLSETHQTLVLNDLRSRVRLQTDGQMRTGRDVAIAAILGAEEYGFSTAALIVMGCVMLRHCHLNNCSLGVATQDQMLEKRFRGKAEHVVNYFCFVAEELRGIMANLGVRNMDELIGNTDLLELDDTVIPPKAKGVDYSRILYKPAVKKDTGVFCQISQNHGLEGALDGKLLKITQKALADREPVVAEVAINNTNRTVGTILSGEIASRYGEKGLPDDTIHIKFKGVAGQSFGAWLARGVTFELEGMANDYVGKGISGGKIIIRPSEKASYTPEENIIIGNTTFYGAIEGEAYIRGVAGERFCIRNSGLFAVTEGTGDHGCEYMTGGRVVILGKTGKNFAAGMSGGIAYVYDPDRTFKKKCNMDMVMLEKLSDNDKEVVRSLIHNHHKYTRSAVAERILMNFVSEEKKFVKVMPLEYKRVLEGVKLEKKLGLSEVSDG